MERRGNPDIDVARFRELLDDERARLEQVRSSVLEESVTSESEGAAIAELSVVDQHPADVGTETFEREKQASILDLAERQLQDVDRAISRLDDGTYGTCEACGVEIPVERLEARPAARFCLDDQQRAEAEAAAGGG
ncbi:MAG TPA: TraR/DksA C4-type zinc finger protein [Actinomycetota bacterium]|nr:TraR/DksA C4-type zinc finger protein [Actinomycetota bacterium]